MRERLDYELGIITSMGFASYFLIVWDFIKFARDRDIPVGPGRGSAVGSIVSYSLHITDLDPLRFGLIFERFLNPSRIEMPDIDTDFCVERRDEVIRYVTEKYGTDRVAQIVTFGTMAARAAVRDAGRALGVPLPDVDRVAKLIPGGPAGLSIKQALEQIPELKALYANSPGMKKLLDTAASIEGLARHASTHAAGVVISKDPLVDWVPLIRIGDDDVNTQYDMSWIARIGLLKMDFLGLRNLTVMKKAVDEIRRTENPDLAPEHPRGRHADVRDARPRRDDRRLPDGIRRHAPRRLRTEAVVARRHHSHQRAVSPRPDGLDPAVHQQQERKTKPRYLHPKLEPILAETYGIACYQEQVMQVARDIAGFSMSEADELRKVMSKKQKDKVAQYRERFINGALKAGIEQKVAEDIFAFIEPFAGYGFPKGHASAYGWIAYQTAYLKANYPRAYLAALMTSVEDKTDKLVEYLEEARKVGVAVLPPDINESLVHFTVAGEAIRFGLAAVKGVGEGAVESILAARQSGPFTDVFDLARRVEGRQVNRKVFEALVKCGACDNLGGNRAQLLDALDMAIEVAARAAREREVGQASLFGAPGEHEELTPQLRDLSPPPLMQLLSWEKETLGIFISGHPLADVADALARTGATPIRDLHEHQEDEFVTIAGLITTVRRTMTKAQQQMLYATIEDMTGSVELIVFPKSYQPLQASFVPDAIVTEGPRADARASRCGRRRRERRRTVGGRQRDRRVQARRDADRACGVARHGRTPRPDRRPGPAAGRVARARADRPPRGRRHAAHAKGVANAVYVRAELEAIFSRQGVREISPT